MDLLAFTETQFIVNLLTFERIFFNICYVSICLDYRYEKADLLPQICRSRSKRRKCLKKIRSKVSKFTIKFVYVLSNDIREEMWGKFS